MFNNSALAFKTKLRKKNREKSKYMDFSSTVNAGTLADVCEVDSVD